MDFIQETWNKARKLNRTIALPEAEDSRVLKAAEIITRSKLAKIILVGNEEKIRQTAGNYDADISGSLIVDPRKSEKIDKYAQLLKDRRAAKGMTIEEARNLLTDDPVYYAAMMVSQGEADGMVSGADHFTADTIKAAVYCVGTAPGDTIISSFFVMILPDKDIGEDGILFFADCGVIPNPNSEQLAEIAGETADSFQKLLGRTPKVAMLSFSTKTSALHSDVDKVIKATEIAKKKYPHVLLDGEMQADAALVPGVGKRKAPGSPVAGQANVLIFPDLDSGNTAYKLIERLAHAKAFGPIFQGVAKPVNDLSRGCSIDDVVNVVAITAVQAQ